jgi:tetratricopeptide (TPR) repeat protein
LSEKQTDHAPYERAARLRLQRLDFDGERRNFLCVAPLSRSGRAGYERAVRELDWALERGASEAPLRALKGKALCFLGHLDDAAAELDRSVGLEGADARALAWRAECLLLRGAHGKALEDLERSRKLDPGYAWTPFFAAAARLAAGDPPAALRELERCPDSDAARVLRALATGRSSSAAEGAKLLERDSKGWPLAFRGMLRAEAGDADAAERDLTAAYRSEKLPWMLDLRCRLRERAGSIREAISDAGELIRLEPASAERRGLRAHLHFSMRKHAFALRDLDAAVRLAPKEARWRLRRADVRLLLGELEKAEKDLHAACLLEPGPGPAEERRAQVRVLLGQPAGAAGPWSDRFWRGYADMRRRRYREAAARFDDAARLAAASEPGRLRRSRLYALTSRILARPFQTPPSKPKGPQLRLCSLGLFPPYTASAEVIGALAGCDVVFNNVAGPETSEWLWSLSPRCVPATFDGARDANRWADRIFRELRAGRVVAFATRGHSQVLGELAYRLLGRSRDAGIPCLPFGGLSCFDVMSAAADDWPVEPEAMAAYDLQALERGAPLDPSRPTAIFFYLGVDAERIRSLGRRLSDVYGPGASALAFGPKYDDPPRPLSLAELAESEEGWHPSRILYLPAEASRSRSRSASAQPGQSLAARSASAQAFDGSPAASKARDRASRSDAE